jgi:thiamine monophosphate kinase
VQFVYRNPHALVQLMAPDTNRQMQRWTVEWEGRGQLDHQGVNGMTLKIGDHVVVTGNPGRNAADHWLRAQAISRPRDGWKWSNTSPSMR